MCEWNWEIKYLLLFPYSLFPIPYSLFPIPYSLFPIPFLFPIPYSLFPIPHSPFPTSYSVLGLRLPANEHSSQPGFGVGRRKRAADKLMRWSIAMRDNGALIALALSKPWYLHCVSNFPDNFRSLIC